MPAGGSAVFAGWVADVAAGLYPGAKRHAAILGDMQVEQVPAGLLVPVTVEVQHHNAAV